MLQKFINLCDLQSYLLWVSKLLVVFILFSSKTFGEWVSAEGQYYIDRKTTMYEACKNALEQAKQNALIKKFGEKLEGEQLEICTDNKEITRCNLYQNTFNSIEGGFIKEIKEKKEMIIPGKPEKFCQISIKVFIEEYKEKPDFNFTLSAKLNNKSRLYEGEKVSISGEVSKESFLTVLGWYPDSDKSSYYQIFPNKFDNKNLIKKFFNVPKEKSSNYQLVTKFPENFKLDETFEFFVIVASKKKLDILGVEKISDFKKRLSILGRSNWEMKKLGYTIMRN